MKRLESSDSWWERKLLEWVEARRAFLKRKIRISAFANNYDAGHGPTAVRLFLQLLEKNKV